MCDPPSLTMNAMVTRPEPHDEDSADSIRRADIHTNYIHPTTMSLGMRVGCGRVGVLEPCQSQTAPRQPPDSHPTTMSFRMRMGWGGVG